MHKIFENSLWFLLFVQRKVGKYIPKEKTTILGFLILIFIFAFSANAYSGERLRINLYFVNYTVENGLPSNTVFSIIQDSLGFIWAGTRQGFTRFDGIKFKTYRTDPKSENSLSFNNAGNLFYDSKGKIWIGTWGNGAECFDPITENFTHYFPDVNNPSALHGRRIQTIFEDSFGTLWFCSHMHGVARLEPKNREKGVFTNYIPRKNNKRSISSLRVRSVVEDSNKNLWFATDDGFCRLKKENRDAGFFERFSVPERFSHDAAVFSLYVTKENNLLVGLNDGYLRIKNPDTFDGKWTENDVLLPHGEKIAAPISAMHVDFRGELWLATLGDGLFVVESDTVVRYYKVEDRLSSKFSDNQITDLYEDRSHNLWFGTMNNGIQKVNLKNNGFRNWRLPYREVHSFAVDNKGKIIIATDKGLIGEKPYREKFGKVPILQGKFYNIISKDYNGNIWAVFERRRIVVLNPETAKVKYPRNLNSKIERENSDIEALFVSDYEKKKSVWIALTNGTILRYAIETEKIYEYFLLTSKELEAITTMFEDGAGNLWLGTTHGLGLWKRNEKVVEFEMPLETEMFYHSDSCVNSLVDNYVQVINEDISGNIWVGTINGISRLKFNQEGKAQFLNFTMFDGLANNGVCGILSDQDGNIWISTEYGLSFLHHMSHKFRNYYVVDGIPDNKFIVGAFKEFDDGRLAFGTRKGFLVFHPARFKRNPYKPTVVVSEFTLLNSQRKISGNVAYKKKIELKPDETSFFIGLSALEFTNPIANGFYFKLQGYDKKWKYSKGKNEVIYMNLPPGEYVFKYAGSNNNRVWNRGRTKLHIIIEPHFWETYWFKFFITVLFIFLLFFIDYKRRVKYRKLKEENDERKRMIAELEKAKEKAEASGKLKTYFLGQISHEIRTPVFTIVNAAEILKNADEYGEEAKKLSLSALDNATERIFRTIDLILRMSELQAGEYSPEKSKTDVVKIVSLIYEKYKPKAENKNLSFEFSCKEKEIFVEVDPDALDLIIDNVVNNAIKYTSEGSVEIRMERNETELTVAVTDTGKGISEKEKEIIFRPFEQGEQGYHRKFDGTGLGLTVSINYCKLNSCSMNLEINTPKGTRVTVTIPLTNS